MKIPKNDDVLVGYGKHYVVEMQRRGTPRLWGAP